MRKKIRRFALWMGVLCLGFFGFVPNSGGASLDDDEGVWALGGSQRGDSSYDVDGMDKKGHLQWMVRPSGVGYQHKSLLVTPQVLFLVKKSDPPELHALDASNGRLLWKLARKAAGAPTPYLFARGILYLVWGNTLLAVKGTKGKELWKRSFKAQPVAPILAQDRVLIGPKGGALFAFHSRTGKRLWSLWTTLGSCPLLYDANEHLFLYKSGQYVQARIASNKRRRWRRKWKGCPKIVGATMCCEQKTKVTPAEDECGSVTTYDSHFAAILLNDGDEEWRTIRAATPYQRTNYTFLATTTGKGLVFRSYQENDGEGKARLVGTRSVLYQIEGKGDDQWVTAYDASAVDKALWKRKGMGDCVPGHKRMFCVDPQSGALASWGTETSGLLKASSARIQVHLQQLAKDFSRGDKVTRKIALANIRVYAGSPATAALVLRWKAPAMQALALRVLGHLGPKAVIAMPNLLGLLRQPSLKLRLAVFGLIAKIGPGAHLAIPAIGRSLAEKEPILLAAALQALGAIGPRAHVALGSVLPLLQHPKEEIRRQAIWAIGQMKRKALSHFFPLKKRIASAKNAPNIVVALLEALGNIGRDFQLVPLFVLQLQSPHLAVKIQAAKGLALLGPRAAEATIPLLRILQEQTTIPSPPIRAALAAPGARVEPCPAPLARQPSPGAKRAAAAPPAQVLTFAQLAEKKRLELVFRKQVAEALYKIGAPAMPRLLLAMLSPNPKMRLSALRALAVWKEEARPAIPALLKALRDPHAIIREEAQGALGLIGEPAMAALFQALFAKDAASRLLARRALLVIGPSQPKYIKAKFLLGTKAEQAQAVLLLQGFGKAALPALLDGLLHANAYVRRMATEALSKMGPAAKGPAVAKALLVAVKLEKVQSLKVAMGKLVQALFHAHKKRRPVAQKRAPRPTPAAPIAPKASSRRAWLWGGLGLLALLLLGGGGFFLARRAAS